MDSTQMGLSAAQKGVEIGQLFVDPNSSAGKKLAGVQMGFGGVQQGLDWGSDFGTSMGW